MYGSKQQSMKTWYWAMLLCTPSFGCSLLIDSETLVGDKPATSTISSSGGNAGASALVQLTAGATQTRDTETSAGNGGSAGSVTTEALTGGASGAAGEAATSGGAAGHAGVSGAGSATSERTFTYDAVNMLHIVGLAEEDGWAASVVSQSQPGFLAYGPNPYPTNWGSGEAMVTFHLMVDDNQIDNRVVATISLYDVDLGVPLVSKDILRSDFEASRTYQAFSLPWVSLAGRQGHRMDSQVYWHNIAYVRVKKAVVETR
jgi:hypothetical protein